MVVVVVVVLLLLTLLMMTMMTMMMMTMVMMMVAVTQAAKTTDGKSTLLHYLAGILEAGSAGFTRALLDELTDVKEASMFHWQVTTRSRRDARAISAS